MWDHRHARRSPEAPEVQDNDLTAVLGDLELLAVDILPFDLREDVADIGCPLAVGVPSGRELGGPPSGFLAGSLPGRPGLPAGRPGLPAGVSGSPATGGSVRIRRLLAADGKSAGAAGTTSSGATNGGQVATRSATAGLRRQAAAWRRADAAVVDLVPAAGPACHFAAGRGSVPRSAGTLTFAACGASRFFIAEEKKNTIKATNARHITDTMPMTGFDMAFTSKQKEAKEPCYTTKT